MPKTIEDVLAHRSDLSTFLVHLTRGATNEDAKNALKSIIEQWTLKRGLPQGSAAPKLRQAGQSDESQKVVCFTETPLEHVKLLTQEIEGRGCQLSTYGVALTRRQGRRLGANPVWYLDQTPGRSGGWLNQDVEALIDLAVASPKSAALQRLLRLTPFIEQMGTWPTKSSRKEFSWEREWRAVGDFALPLRIILLCPEIDFEEMRAYLIVTSRIKLCQMIDPSWSLERIIAHLAGFADADSMNP